MAAILNSAILNLAILDSAILVFPLKLTHTCQDWFPPFAQKNFIHSDSTWWWQPSWICHLGFSHLPLLPRLMMAAILNSILDSAILVFLSNSLTLAKIEFPPFAQKNFTHSFWLNLMMAAILNSAMLDSDTAILDSDTLLSSLRFTQKHSHSTLTLTQTNSIWLKLIHSHSTWWWQPSWILPSWIQPS